MAFVRPTRRRPRGPPPTRRIVRARWATLPVGLAGLRERCAASGARRPRLRGAGGLDEARGAIRCPGERRRHRHGESLRPIIRPVPRQPSRVLGVVQHPAELRDPSRPRALRGHAVNGPRTPACGPLGMPLGMPRIRHYPAKIRPRGCVTLDLRSRWQRRPARH